MKHLYISGNTDEGSKRKVRILKKLAYLCNGRELHFLYICSVRYNEEIHICFYFDKPLLGCSLTLLLCSFVKFVLRLESLRSEFADFLPFMPASYP
jgi:hypothetical protein